MYLVMFSKHLQSLNVNEVGDVLEHVGVDGVVLTTRPGGHVLPENVERDLPAAARTLRERGLRTPMITTEITSAASECAEAVIATAAAQDARLIKMGYWPYGGFGMLRQQLDEARRDMDTLEPLALKYGVTLCLHAHSGDYLTATPGLIDLLLANRSTEAFGAYIDMGHMTVEGGGSGWKLGMDLLSDRTRIVAAKGMGWFRDPGLAGGRPIWEDRLVPLRESAVMWEEAIQYLQEMGFAGPISLHSEYQGGHSWRDLSVEQLIEQTRADASYLRSLIGRSI